MSKKSNGLITKGKLNSLAEFFLVMKRPNKMYQQSKTIISNALKSKKSFLLKWYTRGVTFSKSTS